MNLYQKLLKITDEIGKIEKTGKNTTQNYNFIEAAEVTVQVKKMLVEHGVLILPSATNQQIIQKEKGVKATLDINYTIIDAENPTERMELSWVGEGDDSLDKATQKAGTSAHKYFLMKLFNISDKDDPDADSPDTGKVVSRIEPKKTFGFATNPQRKRIVDELASKGVSGNGAVVVLQALVQKDSTASLTQDEAESVLKQLQGMTDKEVQNILSVTVPFN